MGQVLPGMDWYDQVRHWYEQYGIGMTRYETRFVAGLNWYVTRMSSIRQVSPRMGQGIDWYDLVRDLYLSHTSLVLLTYCFILSAQ